jgi:hypothetical protein
VPYSIPKQLEVVKQLEKILFIPQEYKKFLSQIIRTLKLNIPLSNNEEQKLQDILTEFGYRIQLNN